MSTSPASLGWWASVTVVHADVDPTVVATALGPAIVTANVSHIPATARRSPTAHPVNVIVFQITYPFVEPALFQFSDST
jgi:hypothetical protein